MSKLLLRKNGAGGGGGAFPPLCAGGATFKVLIPNTPASKIKAVAAYKRLKRARALEEEEGAAAAAPGTEQEAAAAAAVGEGSAGTPGGTVDAGQRLILQAPSIGVVVPANKMQTVSDESIHRDLQGFDRNFKLLKREMNALTNVRVSLLWLLKKTTELETQINSSAAAPFHKPQSKRSADSE